VNGSAAALEATVDEKMDIQAVFVGWKSNGAFPTWMSGNVKAENKTLVIFWEQYGTTLDDIIAGNDDAYIREFAAASKTYGGPVILAPFHEMNGNWDPWDGNPTKLIAAWRKVHDVFMGQGVTNVKWGWAPNNRSEPNTYENRFEVYYPGDAYVDYVGVDGFNFGTPWETFAQALDDPLRRLAAYQKPIYIFSMASAAGPLKPAWITDAITVQMPKHPLLKAFIWFNENKERDWRIESDAASAAAFKAAFP